jgi:hypothetical protein
MIPNFGIISFKFDQEIMDNIFLIQFSDALLEDVNCKFMNDMVDF